MKAFLITAVITAALTIGGTAAWVMLGNPLPAALGGPDQSERAASRPIYLPLEPFLVNFEVDGTLRFLQVTVEVMAFEARTIEVVRRHMPRVRNAILLTLGNQTLATIATVEAKEQLRGALRDEIRSVLADFDDGPGIDSVYYTAFVMQ